MPLFLLLVLVLLPAQARWANKTDFAYSIADFKHVTVVKKDGTHVSTEETTYEVHKEAGKQKFSLFSIPFSSSSSTLKVLEAKVINEVEVTSVTSDKIVQRSVGNKSGFDDRKEMQIAFPKVQVGSKIYMKTITEVKEVVVPGHFSTMFALGTDGPHEKGTYIIKSEIQLNIYKQDPYKTLDFTEKKEGEFFVYELNLKIPYLHQTVEEIGHLNASKLTLFSFSNHKDWAVIGPKLKARFEPTIMGPLPKELDPIVTQAKLIPGLKERVNFLVAYIVQNYNYVGDWRTLTGGFSPRKAKDIISTKYGDCKDFASLFVILGRASGLKTDVALVNRSQPYVGEILSKSLPSYSIFNHAIARVKDGDKSYWIDPTNPTSFALNHRLDIANQPIFVLDGQNILEKTPYLPAAENFIIGEKTVSLAPGNVVSFEGKYQMKGILPLAVYTLESQKSKDDVQNFLLKFISQGEEPFLPEFQGLDIVSKSYKDMNFSYKYSGRKLISKDDKSSTVQMPSLSMFLNVLKSDFFSYEGDLFLGDPFIMKRTTKMKNFFLTEFPISCRVDSKWLKVSKQYELNNEGFIQHEFLEIKNPVIVNSELRSQDFKKIMDSTERCFYSESLTFDPAGKAHTNPAAEMEAIFAKLPASERVNKRADWVEKLITNQIEWKGSLAEAIKLLEINFKEDPKHSRSYWLYLRNILYTNNFSDAAIQKALPILAKGIKEAPSQSLYIIHLRLLQLTGKGEEAKALLPKILSIGEPKETRDFTILSDIYQELGERENAFKILENGILKATLLNDQKIIFSSKVMISYKYKKYDQCISSAAKLKELDPKDTSSHNWLPYCYLKLDKPDEAVKAAMDTHDNLHDTCNPISDSLKARGTQHYIKFNLDLAEADFKMALQYENNPEIYIGLARIAKAKGDTEKAYQYILEGGKIDVSKSESLYVKAADAFTDNHQLYEKVMLKFIEVTPEVANKLWGYSALGLALHKLKKRKELYILMEKATAIGEKVVKENPTDKKSVHLLGSLYSLYGSDADNKELINKGVSYLKTAKLMDPSNSRIDQELAIAERVLGNINSGRVPASELNYNLKKE